MTKPVSEFARTMEIEEISNRVFIHPASRLLVYRFARLGIPPNVVSIAGLLSGILAGFAFYHYEDWRMATLGFALMLVWHVMDGADGQLARMTGQTSEIGKVLDGLCDHAAFLSVYIGLGLAVAPEAGGWVWILIGIAAVTHVVQASVYEFQRGAYDFVVRQKQSARIATQEEFREAMKGKTGLLAAFERLHLRYIVVQARFCAQDDDLRRSLDVALASPIADQTSARFRELNLSLVKRWSVLCSNYRTLGIYVVCLAGMPLVFFWYEVIGLNLILALLVAVQSRTNGAMKSWLDEKLAPGSGSIREFADSDAVARVEAADDVDRPDSSSQDTPVGTRPAGA